MRVLWVTALWPDERLPQRGSFIYSQAQSLQRLGVELDVVSIKGYVRQSDYLRAVGTVRRKLGSSHYDVVHAHYGHCGVVGRLQVGTPLVLSYCGSDLLGTPTKHGSASLNRTSLVLAAGFARLAHLCRATITKSEQMAERLPVSCRKRNHVIPNGVDLSRFAPMSRQEARRRLGWSHTRPNVLFVGNPQLPRKNFALAELVCEELARRARPVCLRIGWNVRPAEMPTWLSAADALLFPSFSEGSPNTIKEAMAIELPIVSAPVGDVPERLAGVAGTYIVERDPQLMADALMGALEHDRAEGAREAVAKLSAERVAQQVLAVYREAIS